MTAAEATYQYRLRQYNRCADRDRQYRTLIVDFGIARLRSMASEGSLEPDALAQCERVWKAEGRRLAERRRRG